jgi:hypothetical protein
MKTLPHRLEAGEPSRQRELLTGDKLICSNCGGDFGLGSDYCETTELCADCYEWVMGEPMPDLDLHPREGGEPC